MATDDIQSAFSDLVKWDSGGTQVAHGIYFVVKGAAHSFKKFDPQGSP